MIAQLDRGQILSMEAGLELDELLHESIFGKCAHVLTVDPMPAKHGEHNKFMCRKCGQTGFDFTTDYEGRHTGTPNYSTDIAAAWQIVDKLNLFRELRLGKENDVWFVYREAVYGSDDWEIFAGGQTAPMAICRAALLLMAEER